MERIRELRDEIPELIAERQRVNALWAASVLRSMRRHGADALPERRALLRVHAAIFMAEDLLREIFVIRNPNVSVFGEDEELLVLELSQLWVRALYQET